MCVIGNGVSGIVLGPRSAGVCDGLVDPLLDARVAHPIWLEDSEPLVQLDRVGEAPAKFSLWKLPGRKALWHDGKRLLLDIFFETRTVRLTIAGSLRDGAPFGYAMPAGFEPLRYKPQLESAVAIVQAPPVAGGVSRPRPPRAALIHMRTLQVLDALNAGASQRAIAVALFGAARIARRWEPDSELRAQVRYLIRRGREHVQRGYRELIRARHRS